MINYKNILLIIILSSFLVGISSCKKYLDEKSDKSLVVPKSLDDLQGLLDDYTYMNIAPGLGEASSDDYFITQNTYNQLSDMQQKIYKISYNDFRFSSGDWSKCYAPIYNANYCLEQISNIDANSSDSLKWNNVLGSAHFYRGYNFLSLLGEYSKAYDESTSSSDLGIVLRLGSDFNVESVRSNVKDSYNQVISDLKIANQFLPSNPINDFRPSKAASYALLSRTYLMMNKYDSALKYANLSLQLKSDLLDYNNSNQVNWSAFIPFKPFNTEIIFYTTMTNVSTANSANNSLIDTLLYSSYQNNDLRKSVFFSPNGHYFKFKGNYSSSTDTYFGGIAVDEMFLTRSECNARLGHIAEAMNDVNTLLAKRYITGMFVSLSAASSQQALNIILLERRKELLKRGLRWLDIKRLNKTGANISVTRLIGNQIFSLPPNDNKYALPLPSDIINATTIPQNPGW